MPRCPACITCLQQVSRVEVTQGFRGSCWKQPTKHCFDLIHPWRSFIFMSRATMTSLPFIQLFWVQFLLSGPCAQCNPVDGAEEQLNLTQETQSLLLNIDWRVGTASGRDDLSRCTCYTDTVPLQEKLLQCSYFFPTNFPASCIWNDHSACNVPYRQGETWTTTRTEVNSNSENSHCCELQWLPSSTFLALRAEGQGIPTQIPVMMWAQLSPHPRKGISFSWVACLKGESEYSCGWSGELEFKF